VELPGRYPGSSALSRDIRLVVDKKPLARELPPEVAAYIAGLIDGEGTITLTRLHSNENRRLVVSIANTERQLLQFVLDHVGAGKITRKRTTSERHTPSYCYVVSSGQALALLTKAFPHLQTYKRRRAELALKHYKALTPRNGKYTSELLSLRQDFEHTFLSIRPTQ
jgi:LAGLIDADG-like domain